MNMNDRDAWIVAKALHIAKRQLRTSAHPPAGDISAMDAILAHHFSGFKAYFDFEDMLQRAVRLGMPLQLGTSYTAEMLNEFISANSDDVGNVCAFSGSSEQKHIDPVIKEGTAPQLPNYKQGVL